MIDNNKMSLSRTDLARELYRDEAEVVVKRCIEYDSGDNFSFIVEEARISNTGTAKAFSKPKGKYITINSPKVLSLLSLRASLSLSKLLSIELRRLSSELSNDVIVIGLGNRDMTVDSLGVKCAEMIKPTRSCEKSGVSIVIPGVEASTGISAIELISSVVQRIKPSAVLAVDSLAARYSENLGTTIQLCDSGISPGSGLGKRNIVLNRETLGIPVISLGVPMVISAKHLLSEKEDFYVGLVESDAVVESASRIMAVAIEEAFS